MMTLIALSLTCNLDDQTFQFQMYENCTIDALNLQIFPNWPNGDLTEDLVNKVEMNIPINVTPGQRNLIMQVLIDKRLRCVVVT